MAEQELVQVRVHTLGGSCFVFDVPDQETALDLKHRVAASLNQATGHLALLCGDKVLQNEDSLVGLAQTGEGIVELHVAHTGLQREATQVEQVDAIHGDPLKALEFVFEELQEAGVKQGQVLWVDLHHCDLDDKRVEARAYFCRDLPARGTLRLALQTQCDKSWEALHSWADKEAMGKDVVAITGTTARGVGLFLCIVSYEGETTPTPSSIQHVAVEGRSWSMAALSLVFALHTRGVQRGQLLGIDAHNRHSLAPAQFTAHYCPDQPGLGGLGLDFENSTLSRIASEKAGRRLVSTTGCADDEDRLVVHSFFHVQGEPLEMCLASAPSWEEAATQVCQKLLELGVDRNRLLTVDAHNRGHSSPCVVCAHYAKLKDGEEAGPPLQASVEVTQIAQAADRAGLCAQAGQRQKDVLSITGSSGNGGIFCLTFYDTLSLSTPCLRTIMSPPASDWETPASWLTAELTTSGVPRHHIVSIDACNAGPNAPAQFFAHIDSSRTEPGAETGTGESPAGRVLHLKENVGDASYEDLHGYMNTKGAGKDVISITGCSNEMNRIILYMFYWEPAA